MQTSTLPSPRGLNPALTGRPTAPTGGWLATLGEILRQWRLRARGRRDLRTMLNFYRSLGGPVPWSDLGASRGEVLQEARKPFWRA